MQVYYIQPNVPGAKPAKLIENLSVSNGDHVVSGLDFLNDGRLIVSDGSQTNAGIEGRLGYLPDNPASTSILAFNIRAAGFSGKMAYQFMGCPGKCAEGDALDQRLGEWAAMATNSAVQYWATGTRNPFGLKVGFKGNVMCTINGPNLGFGAAMNGIDGKGLAIKGPDPETRDAFFLDLKQVRSSLHCKSQRTVTSIAGGLQGTTVRHLAV
jgi:hypothetical protein